MREPPCTARHVLRRAAQALTNFNHGTPASFLGVLSTRIAACASTLMSSKHVSDPKNSQEGHPNGDPDGARGTSPLLHAASRVLLLPVPHGPSKYKDDQETMRRLWRSRVRPQSEQRYKKK